MGTATDHSITIHIPQNGLLAVRDLTIAVSKSDSNNKADIFTDVTVPSVIRWNPDETDPPDERSRGYVVVSELFPGVGYWMKAIGDSIQLIPGDPIEENVRP